MLSQYQSPLFKLPKELRLAIYEYALESTTHTILGTHCVNARNLADWPLQSGLVRTCSMLREEALPIYFAQTPFHIALQSQGGRDMVLAWIHTNSSSYPKAFNHLRHLKLTVGSGVYDRPEEFVVDLERREIVSSRTQLPQRNLMFGEDICAHPAFHFLRYHLARMPGRREDGFELAEWLGSVMRTLFMEFTLEEAGGFML